MHAQALGLALVASLTVAVPLAAQQGTAELGGKVTDQQGGVLPGVAIVVTNEARVCSAKGLDTRRSYFVSQIVPGRYRVTAKMQGFRSLERRGIVIEVGRTQTLDLVLDVGAIAETITVSGDTPLVDLSSAEIGGHITAAEIRAACRQSKLHGVCGQRARRTAYTHLPASSTTPCWPTARPRLPTTSCSTAPGTSTTSEGRTSAVRRGSPMIRSRKYRC